MNAASRSQGAAHEDPGANLKSTATIDQAGDIPPHQPWARRPDAKKIERRFQLDRECWRRRILAARRLSHDAQDELVAPYHGRWTA
jgi:hypothetical protein